MMFESDAPEVVLLHGASGNAATWRSTEAFWQAAGISMLALDLPGRGDSSHLSPRRTAAEAAAWLMAQLEGRGLDKPVLLGHSFGGAVALEAALAAPERLGGIVLVASASRLKVSPQILSAVAASTSEAPFALDFAFGPQTPDGVESDYHAAAAPTPPAAALADWKACDAFDIRDRLGEIELPVLVLHGDADRLTAAKYQGRLAEALPRGERIELPGVGHMLPWEAPEEMARAVASWMDGLPGR